VVAQESGKLTAALRHPDDDRLIAASSLDVSKVLGRKENIATQNSRGNVDVRSKQNDEPMTDAVQVIYGGMGNNNLRPANLRTSASKAGESNRKTNARREMINEVAENTISGMDLSEAE